MNNLQEQNNSPIEIIKMKIEKEFDCEINGVIGMFIAATSSTALGVLTAIQENLSTPSIVGAGALGLSLGSLAFASSYKIMHIIEEERLKDPNLNEEERKSLLKKIIENKFNQITNMSQKNKESIEDVKETKKELLGTSEIAKERLISYKKHVESKEVNLVEIPNSVLNIINSDNKQDIQIKSVSSLSSKIDRNRNNNEISSETKKIISSLRK